VHGTLRPGVDRGYLRLTLPGAINWTLIWYRPGGDPPASTARRIVDIARQGAAG
jgi:TetR/AcrR family transcriptional regulator, cholesterol catabolism regulator